MSVGGTEPGPALSLRNAVLTSTGLLSLALVAVELVAGMQVYLTQTTVPLAAGELGGRSLYGVLTACSQAATFLTMPLGGRLLSRFRADRLLLALTGLTIAGSVLCALSLTMAMFIAAAVVRGLAAGALATVSMGLVAVGLPRRWRQLVLAGMSATWIVSSILGPVYASWVSAAAGWRWAMVGYLPLLVVARAVVARQLKGVAPEGGDARLRVGAAVLLAIGALAIAVPAPTPAVSLGFAALGGALLLTGLAHLLPSGTFVLRRGRPSGFAFLFGLTATYFGGDGVIAIVAHDTFGLSPGQIGVVIGAGGLSWAILGVYCGTRPAASDRPYLARCLAGAALIVAGYAGVVAIAVSPAGTTPRGEAVVTTLLALACAASGAGMGLAYVDTLGRLFERRDDGIAPNQAAAGVVLAEAVGTALATTLATSFVATGFGLSLSLTDRTAFLFGCLAAGAVTFVGPLSRLRE